MTRITYRYLALSILALLLYALLNLLAGLQFLPSDGVKIRLFFPQISRFAASFLDLAIVGGLLGGGLYALFTPYACLDQRLPRLFSVAFWLWLLLFCLTVIAGIFNLLNSWELLLALLKAIAILLILSASRRYGMKWTPIGQIWFAGMLLVIACLSMNLLTLSDFNMTAIIHVLALGINTYIAQVLAAVALMYWLIGRFSTVPTSWAEMSLYTVAGLLSITGVLVTLSTLEPLVNIGGIRTLIALIAPLLTLIFASHIYLAFSNRNTTNTLAAHWAALGVILLLLGIGLLGGLQATVRIWTAGTRLDDLQPLLASQAVVAILLGVINQAVFEMRGQPRRVTGLAPFWLVAFGMIGGGLMLAGAGLVQVYLERLIGLSYLETQALSAPLYGLWVLGLALMTLGLLLYGLIHWLRRPRF
ncbi:MAG: hypothetical protein ABI700_08160 [Chloroflexota bacterium]